MILDVACIIIYSYDSISVSLTTLVWLLYIYLISFLIFTTLAGLPTAIAPDGTSLVTTEPAPIAAPSPMDYTAQHSDPDAHPGMVADQYIAFRLKGLIPNGLTGGDAVIVCV